MNKKLFSWKALAGLALLVAMGLTSCTGDTVDPTDPTGEKKPTTPGSSTTGKADVTITILKSADFVDQWDKLSAKVKKELREKTTLTIAVNSASYKLDGKKITLPNFFAGATNGTTGKVVNLQFTSNFENAGYGWTLAEYGMGDINPKKLKYLFINTDNLAGNQVNITVPSMEFDFRLESTMTQTNILSTAASIGILTATSAANKSAVTLKSGVSVWGLDLRAGDFNIDGGSLFAKVISANDTYQPKDWWDDANGGFVIGASGIGSGVELYTKNVIVENGANVNIIGNTNNSRVVGNIILKKNSRVNLTAWEPRVNNIEGENSNAIVNLAGNLENGYARDLKYIGTMSNVTLVANAPIKLADASDFVGVNFTDQLTFVGESFANNALFGGLVLPISDDDVTVSFNNVNFCSGVTISGEYETIIATRSTTYQWVVSNDGTTGTWQAVTGANPLKEYNKNETVQEFDSNDVDVNPAGALIGWNIGAVTSKVIKIIYNTPEWIRPENCLISVTNCAYFWDGLQGDNVNTLFGNVAEWRQAWYYVAVNGVVYNWKQTTGGTWVLMKP